MAINTKARHQPAQAERLLIANHVSFLKLFKTFLSHIIVSKELLLLL